MLRLHKRDQLNDTFIRGFIVSLVSCFMQYTPLPLLKLLLLLIDVLTFWIRTIIKRFRYSRERILLNQINNSTSWSEFSHSAFQLDNVLHYDVWKDNLVSGKYDYRLIQERLHDLQNSRTDNNLPKLLSLLRAGMLRNFGGISNKRLYNRTYIGTKRLIEQYNKEISNCLEWIDNNDEINNQIKLDFYHDAKTTLGSTAICLHGGSLFGLCHIGVIKALINEDLLPNVIVGSGVGSAIGALICCLSKTQVFEILNHVNQAMQDEGFTLNNKNQKSNNGDETEIYLQWIDNIKRGLTIELKLFIKFILSKIGKITFKEAYITSGKSFNILVYPNSNKIPTLLNFLSTPYITIESAIYCSLGNGILDDLENDPIGDSYNNIYQLMIKYNDEITEFSTVECTFKPPYQVGGDSVELKNSPYDRITELFNVNHFIVSISRPYLAPFLNGDWRITYKKNTLLKKLSHLINIEFKHRIRMMSRVGILSSLMKWLLVDEKSMLLDTNYIPIIPVGNSWFIWDIFNLFMQNHSVMDYWIKCGERSVWGIHSLLETRVRTEKLLEEYYEKYRKIN